MVGKSSGISEVTDPVVSLDSVSVCAEDLGKTAAFLSDVMGWKRHPVNLSIFMDADGAGIETAFVDGNGAWLHLVSATNSKGGSVNERDNGTFFKLNFSTHNYDQLRQDLAYRGLASIGRTPVDTLVHELSSGQSIAQRIASYTTDDSQKTVFDIYENTDDGQSSIIAQRDKTWNHREADRNVPRIDRIAIIVEDIDASIDFYTSTLGLKLNPMHSSVASDDNQDIGGFRPAFIYANSVWLVLVQPVGGGPLMDTLRAKGDGHVLEIITEVDDLDAFYDKMKHKGITLLCVDGKTPLDDHQKSQVLEPFGDKLAYIPTDISQGMVIEVFERGPRHTSLIHQRDTAFLKL